MTEQSTISELSSKDWEQMPESGKALIFSLLQRVAALEEQVKLNSQNFNKPPNSDFKSKNKKKRKPSGKKRGGQPGHKGKARILGVSTIFHRVQRPNPLSGFALSLHFQETQIVLCSKSKLSFGLT